jgi:hypothetical protein
MFSKRNYFARYLAVFCIPVLLLGILLFGNNALYSYQEMASLRRAALMQMVDVMDSMQEQAQAVADKVGANDEMVFAKRGSDADYRQVSQWLGFYENLFVDQVTLAYYLLGDDHITTRQGTMPYSEFENKNADMINFSLAGLFKTLNFEPRITTLNLYRETGAYYALAYTYPMVNKQAKHVGTFCVLVPQTVLMATFEKFVPGENADLYILDAANKPVYAPAGKHMTARALLKQTGMGAISQGPEGVVQYAISNKSKFTYIVAMPQSSFFADTGNLVGILGLLIAVLALLSAVLAAMLAKNHYSNLQKMHGRNLNWPIIGIAIYP